MSRPEPDNKSKLKKLAILLTVIGREAAQEIIKQFQSEEIERLGIEMARCKEVNQAEAEEALAGFISDLRENNNIARGGIEYVEQVLTPVMEPERAQRIIRKIQKPRQIIPFENLHEIAPEKLIEALKEEHPQTVALVVANLPSDLSARILMQIPEDRQGEITRRVAQLDCCEPNLEIVSEIETRLSQRLKQEDEKPELSKFGGAQTCADILNFLDKPTVHNILENMENKNESLATEVKMKMVRFDDLVKLTDQEVQRILKEVETQDLATACIKSEQAVEETIFKNMSQRGAEMLKDDIEVMQNVKPDAIRAARMKIAETMRRLDDEGHIVLNKGSLEDEVV